MSDDGRRVHAPGDPGAPRYHRRHAQGGRPHPVLWEGKFLTSTSAYTPEERERLQIEPLRRECERIGIAWAVEGERP